MLKSFFLLPLIFSLGCEAGRNAEPGASSQCCGFDKETFLNNSKGEYKLTVTSTKEGSREFVVIVEKHFYKRYQEDLLSIHLKADGKTVRNFGYQIPKNISKSSTGKFKIPFNWKKTSFSSKGGSSKFIYIEDIEYFPAEAIFKAVNTEGQNVPFFKLEELILWKTGFTPPALKKKYRLKFDNN